MENLNRRTASPFMVILAFATVYIVWGSTYFFIQKAIVSIPPFLLGALRFLIAGILILGWSKFRGEPIFIKKDIKRASISGILMLFVGTGAVIWVEQYMPSAMVAIMVSSAPLWFVLMDKPNWTKNLTSKVTIYGLILGFAGIILLFSEQILSLFKAGSSQHDLGGLVILIIGSIAWSAGSLYSKYKPTSGSVSVNIGWQMLAAAAVFIPISFFRGEMRGLAWDTISIDAWLSVLYLVFFGSIAAFSAYVWLLKVRPATQVSTYAYVNPLVAVLLGVFFAGEHISLLQVLGLLTILVSVLIINLGKYRKDHLAVQKKKISAKPVLSKDPVNLYRQIAIQPIEDIELKKYK